MLYAIAGKNHEKAREALEQKIGMLLKADSEASMHEISDEDFSEAKFEELVFSRGLFGKSVIVCFRLFADPEREKFILKHLGGIVESGNDIIFFEETLHKNTESRLQKKGARVERYDAGADGKAEKFPVFAVAEALKARDKKKAWTALVGALEADIPPEQIHGIIHWQIKTLSMRGTPLWKKEELQNVSSKLFRIYHDAHRGGLPLDLALEKFVLTM